MAKQVFEPRKGVLTRTNLLPANVTTTANTFVDLGRFIVPVGMAVELGFGGARGQAETEGRVFIDIRDNTATPGVAINNALVRLELRDPQDRTIETLYEDSVENLRMGAGNRTQQLPFAANGIVVTENNRIVLQIRTEAVTTIGSANTIIQIDTTTYTVRETITE